MFLHKSWMHHRGWVTYCSSVCQFIPPSSSDATIAHFITWNEQNQGGFLPSTLCGPEWFEETTQLPVATFCHHPLFLSQASSYSQTSDFMSSYVFLLLIFVPFSFYNIFCHLFWWNPILIPLLGNPWHALRLLVLPALRLDFLFLKYPVQLKYTMKPCHFSKCCWFSLPQGPFCFSS